MFGRMGKRILKLLKWASTNAVNVMMVCMADEIESLCLVESQEMLRA